MRINLNQLRAFYLAAREKNLTKAAEALFVTQPAVTLQIQGLEESLGISLLKKRGKTFELTDAGTTLFSYAERIFEVVDEMEHVLKGLAMVAHGSLTIGTTRSFARHLMPGLLSRYQETFPGVKVTLEVGNSQQISEGVLGFRYDLGIIARLPLPSKLRVIPYSREEFVLVMSPDHPLAKREKVPCSALQEEPIIIREHGSGSRHAILSFLNSQGINPSVLIEAGSVEFIKEYVMKGRGVSILYKPEIQWEAAMGLIRVLAIEEGPVWLMTDIVVPRNVTLSPPASAFLDIVKTDPYHPHGPFFSKKT